MFLEYDGNNENNKSKLLLYFGDARIPGLCIMYLLCQYKYKRTFAFPFAASFGGEVVFVSTLSLVDKGFTFCGFFVVEVAHQPLVPCSWYLRHVTFTFEVCIRKVRRNIVDPDIIECQQNWCEYMFSNSLSNADYTQLHTVGREHLKRQKNEFSSWVRCLKVTKVGFKFRDRSSNPIECQIMDDGLRQVVYIVQ